MDLFLPLQVFEKLDLPKTFFRFRYGLVGAEFSAGFFRQHHVLPFCFLDHNKIILATDEHIKKQKAPEISRR